MVFRRLLFFALIITGAFAAEPQRVGLVPAPIRTEFKLSPFYAKYLDAGGMPIVASDKVSDFAFLEAHFLVEKMIGHRPDILAAMAKNHVRLAIMAPDQMTTDIPEHSDLTPKDYWDKRARGLGATNVRPAVSCGEENLLGLPGDPYAAENILIHEFAHTIHERGLSDVDKTFDGRLHAAYDAATREGLWKGTYGGSNYVEYWAVGTQAWFDAGGENDAQHNAVNTRPEMKTYDRRLTALLAEIYGDGDWRYALPAKRSPASPHLAGFDVTKAPHFTWPARLIKMANGAPAEAMPDAPTGGGPLVALAPSLHTTWRSVAGPATKIIFQNSTGAPVQVDWMDYEGRPKTYFTLRPGAQTEAATFAGNIWRARDQGGTVLGYFVAGSEAATAVIKGAAGQ